MSRLANKHELTLMIELLRQAKKYLWDGGAVKDTWMLSAYICFALDKVTAADLGGAYRWEEVARLRGAVKLLIQSSLDGYTTVGDYLVLSKGVGAFRMSEYEIQKYRHRWVNRIIRSWTHTLRNMS